MWVNKALPRPSRDSELTQVLWAGTSWVGCADAVSQSGKVCSASVCYYAKAGNCGWNKFESWKKAVTSGVTCSKNCPPDAVECTL